MQRIRTILTTVFARRPERQPAPTTDRIDTALQDHQHTLEVHWWLWRHGFLEVKRLQLEAQHERSDQ